MVGEVFAGISALKAAFDLTKGLKDIDDATRRNVAVIELQQTILSAQAAQAEMVETVRDLKRRLAEFETWEAEKQRYKHRDVGGGPLAHVLTDSKETFHYICPSCFQRRRKSILQPFTGMYSHTLSCPECKLELSVSDRQTDGNTVAPSDFDP